MVPRLDRSKSNRTDLKRFRSSLGLAGGAEHQVGGRPGHVGRQTRIDGVASYGRVYAIVPGDLGDLAVQRTHPASRPALPTCRARSQGGRRPAQRIRRRRPRSRSAPSSRLSRPPQRVCTRAIPIARLASVAPRFVSSVSQANSERVYLSNRQFDRQTRVRLMRSLPSVPGSK